MNLITTKRNLEKHLSLLDANTAEDRNAAVSAIEELVLSFVIPAMNVGSLKSDSIYTFDLDEIAGTEIHNLMLSLFESKMDGLNKPSAEHLRVALVSIGVKDLNESEREKFYQVWAGEKAVEAISLIAKFLSTERSRSDNSEEWKSQDERIMKLFKSNLPESVKSYLKMILSSDPAAIK